MQIFTFLTALFLVLGTFRFTQAQKPKRCEIRYRCSDTESPVWATTDAKTCEVFRNECFLLSENCSRVNSNKPEATKIDKKKCQALCADIVCLKVYAPVCGSYNGKHKTFGNDCEMRRHICSTGERTIRQVKDS